MTARWLPGSVQMVISMLKRNTWLKPPRLTRQPALLRWQIMSQNPLKALELPHQKHELIQKRMRPELRLIIAIELSHHCINPVDTRASSAM